METTLKILMGVAAVVGVFMFANHDPAEADRTLAEWSAAKQVATKDPVMSALKDRQRECKAYVNDGLDQGRLSVRENSYLYRHCLDMGAVNLAARIESGVITLSQAQTHKLHWE